MNGGMEIVVKINNCVVAIILAFIHYKFIQ